MKKRLGSRFAVTHGLTDTPTYWSWIALKQRCFNKKNQSFSRYGGRGISVCSRWLKFENFYADMGERPLGKSLDRINNNGNYEPKNCRWASSYEQSHNTSRNVFYTYKGHTKTMDEWFLEANKNGIKWNTFKHRIYLGWSIDRAIEEPTGPNARNAEIKVLP